MRSEPRRYRYRSWLERLCVAWDCQAWELAIVAGALIYVAAHLAYAVWRGWLP
jgi:hypothetical protein